jgi:hypothetical protein
MARGVWGTLRPRAVKPASAGRCRATALRGDEPAGVWREASFMPREVLRLAWMEGVRDGPRRYEFRDFRESGE